MDFRPPDGNGIELQTAGIPQNQPKQPARTNQITAVFSVAQLLQNAVFINFEQNKFIFHPIHDTLPVVRETVYRHLRFSAMSFVPKSMEIVPFYMENHFHLRYITA